MCAQNGGSCGPSRRASNLPPGAWPIARRAINYGRAPGPGTGAWCRTSVC
jgi:hypothetical protein